MIRPSALQVAEHCSLAPVLAQQFPTKNENTERGNSVDGAVSEWVKWAGAVDLSNDPDVVACCDWIGSKFPKPWRLWSQQRVQLKDPDTGGVVTEGTLDVVAENGSARHIIDLKKREQYAAGRLADPDDNLQLHAYALAVTPPDGSYQLTILLFGDGEVEALTSKVYTRETWTSFLNRIIEINARIGEPQATSGPHCGKCYQRAHCPAWALPVHQGPTVLEPFTRPGGLTKENIGRGVMAAYQIREMADRVLEAAKAWALDNCDGEIPVGGGRSYRLVTMPGRVSVDAKALEAAGLYERFAKVGRPYTQWRMSKARKQEAG